MDAAFHFPLNTENFSAPLRHFALNGIMQHFYALAESKDIYTACYVYSIGGGDWKDRADAEALLLRRWKRDKGCGGGKVIFSWKWRDGGDCTIAAKDRDNLQKKKNNGEKIKKE